MDGQARDVGSVGFANCLLNQPTTAGSKRSKLIGIEFITRREITEQTENNGRSAGFQASSVPTSMTCRARKQSTLEAWKPADRPLFSVCSVISLLISSFASSSSARYPRQLTMAT